MAQKQQYLRALYRFQNTQTPLFKSKNTNVIILLVLKEQVATTNMPASSNKQTQNNHCCQLTKPCAKNSKRRLLVSDCISAGENGK